MINIPLRKIIYLYKCVLQLGDTLFINKENRIVIRRGKKWKRMNLVFYDFDICTFVDDGKFAYEDSKTTIQCN